MKFENINEYRYWKMIRSIGFSLLFFLLFLTIFQLWIAFLPLILNFLPISSVANTIIYQLNYAAGYLLSFMLPVPILKRLIRKSGFEYQPMKSPMKLSPWLPLIIFGGIAVIWSLAYVNSFMVSIVNYSEFSSEYLWGSQSRYQWYELVLQFMVFCLVPAICEEFLFRGAILTNCLPFGRGNAILISALLFGVMHQNAEQILYAFGAGILLGVVYEKTGSIWNCFFLHMINNFISTFEPLFFEKIGTRYFGLATTVFEILLFVLGTVCIIFLIIRFSPGKQKFEDGIFEKKVLTSDSYAACSVSARKAVKLFVNVPMVLFFVFAAIQILALVMMAGYYG